VQVLRRKPDRLGGDQPVVVVGAGRTRLDNGADRTPENLLWRVGSHVHIVDPVHGPRAGVEDPDGGLIPPDCPRIHSRRNHGIRFVAFPVHGGNGERPAWSSSQVYGRSTKS